MTLYGIDISNYQAGLDLAAVRAEGFEFVWAKVSEGIHYRDPTWPGFRDAARANGLLLAGYHYVRADSSADAQARTFVEHLGDATIPAMLDFEADSGDMEVFWAVANAIDALGVHVALSYIPRWYWQQIGRPDLSQVPGLIQSSYVVGTGYASVLYPGDDSYRWTGYGGKSVDILQFTSSALVAGQKVDADAFRGTREELAALISPAPRQEGDGMTPEQAQQLRDIWTQLMGPNGNGWPQLGNRTLVDACAVILDQLVGPDHRFGGWPQTGGRTDTDAIAAVGAALNIPGFSDTKAER
ncbi:glycoside hydrolase family 25 protein [Rhodococcus sp. NPDC003322]